MDTGSNTNTSKPIEASNLMNSDGNRSWVRLSAGLKLLLTLGTVVLLSACHTPTDTELGYNNWGNQTRAEIEAWAASEIDAAIEASETDPAEWYLWRDESEPQLNWDTGRDELLARASRGTCVVDDHKWVPATTLEFSMIHNGHGDWEEMVERVRERWTLDDWIVTTVISPDQVSGLEYPFAEIRADRVGERAGLGFSGNANLLTIDIFSDCSEDASMRR